MDPFELLEADHKKVAELFDRLEAAHGKAKLDIFKKIKIELDVHAHIEEKFLYPALEKPEKTHDLTLESYEEHAVVKTLLEELAAATSANDEWQAKAKVLRENVEHHVEEEEGELFGDAKDVLSDEQIAAIGQKMEAEKAKKLGLAKPAAPQAAKSRQASARQPGIISRLASAIGLGGTAKKKPAKKAPTKKSSTRAAAKKKSTKSANATVSKRSAAAQAAKRVAPKPAASKKKAGTVSKSKAARKR